MTLNLPIATPSLTRHEFANLSQAVDGASLLDDPLKNGCLLLHLAQVLRGHHPSTPPWCKALGRPMSVAAVRKNVETALELVQPLLMKASVAEQQQGREQGDLVNVEALVAGDDVAIWSLLHRLRLASRHSLLLGGSAGLSGGGGQRETRAGSTHKRKVLPYSEEQVELLEAALVIWLSSVALHVPALRAVLPAPDDAAAGYAQWNLVGSAPRLLGMVLAEMHASGGILLASVASLATGMPVRVMRSVKSHAVAVGNMRRICEQLGDMNHVGRRFLPWIPNIMRGERHATILLLEELMRCAYAIAPGRKLTAKGNYARCTSSPSSAFSFSAHSKCSKAREIPFLQPLTKSRVAAGARGDAAADAPLLQAGANDGAQRDVYAATSAADLARHRQFEQHQLWRHSIASAVKDLPAAWPSLHSTTSDPATTSTRHTVSHESPPVPEMQAPPQGTFGYLEDLEAHLELTRAGHAPSLTRAKSGSSKASSARYMVSRSTSPGGRGASRTRARANASEHTANAVPSSSRAGAARSQQMEAARAFVREAQGAETALETEAAPLQGSKSSKAKDSKVKGNGDATGAPASSTEYCLRCIHWNGKRAKTPDHPLLGARKGASSNQGDKQGAGVRSAGVRSPFRLANSAPKACEPVSPDDASEVGRLREWMRALKAGSIQWPESVMMCAPADFAACWSDGVALCLLAGALQPLAGRTLLQGWEKRPRTRAHRAHNVRRALSVLGLQAKMHVLHVPILLNNSSVSWHARADSALLSALSNATTGTLRGSQALLSDEAVLDGDASIVLALLRLVRLAYRPP